MFSALPHVAAAVASTPCVVAVLTVQATGSAPILLPPALLAGYVPRLLFTPVSLSVLRCALKIPAMSCIANTFLFAESALKAALNAISTGSQVMKVWTGGVE